MQGYEIIKKPVITEKSTAQAEVNQYTFLVSGKANKIEIARAVEDAFGVKVLGVNVLVGKPKQKIRQTKSGRVSGTISGYKKAIVTLKEGKIDLFTEKEEK